MFNLVILLVLVLSSAYAQLEVDVPCDFTGLGIATTPSQYLFGTWYQIERITNDRQNGDCSSTSITAVMDKGSVVTVEVSNREVVDGKLVYWNGTATNSSTYSGVFNVNYTDGNSYDYAVLGSNNEYAVLYSCQDNNKNGSSVWAWKYSRYTKYSDAARNRTDKIVANYGQLSNATWKVTSFSEDACNGRDGHSPTVFVLAIAMALVKLM